MPFQLPDLPYAHDALAPYMSRETLEYHHDKHHKAYVDNGNKLLEGSGLENKSLEEVVKASFGKNAGLFNNAGQHYNHIHFWKWMKPNGLDRGKGRQADHQQDTQWRESARARRGAHTRLRCLGAFLLH